MESYHSVHRGHIGLGPGGKHLLFIFSHWDEYSGIILHYSIILCGFVGSKLAIGSFPFSFGSSTVNYCSVIDPILILLRKATAGICLSVHAIVPLSKE